MDGRDKFGSFENRTGDAAGYQFRIGYHPGVRIYVPPPPPPPPPAPPAAPANRPPTVVARCEPCTVEVGKASTVTADASDPDGDTLTLQVERADRLIHECDRASDAVDRADAGRAGAADRPR